MNDVLPALRRVAAKGYKTPLTVASNLLDSLEDASFGLYILAEDYDRDALAYHYTVDISKTPWKVVQETCEGYKMILHEDKN